MVLQHRADTVEELTGKLHLGRLLVVHELNEGVGVRHVDVLEQAVHKLTELDIAKLRCTGLKRCAVCEKKLLQLLREGHALGEAGDKALIITFEIYVGADAAGTGLLRLAGRATLTDRVRVDRLVDGLGADRRILDLRVVLNIRALDLKDVRHFVSPLNLKYRNNSTTTTEFPL